MLFRPDDHDPRKTAVVVPSTGRTVSYGELVDRSTQFANLLHRRGLRPGDHVAILMTNTAEYFEVVWGARRSGSYYTAVNWHLTPAEVRYILQNSQARALVVSDDLAALADEAARGLPGLRLIVGGEREGWERYEDAIAGIPTEREAPDLEGQAMLYSSGTTGRPKGIVHGPVDFGRAFGDITGDMLWTNRYDMGPGTVSLTSGPLYHAAPLVSSMATHRYGGLVVLLPRFDALEALKAIDRYRVTHAQIVPTMFVRLLRLPADVRDAYDVSSLEAVAHSAAPCPVDVKRRMLEWWGPVIWEYYSATEAAGHVSIGPEEWLEHPGSVGKPREGTVAIADEDGRALPTGEDGTIWFTDPAKRFRYHNDEQKSASMYNADGWARMGDVGHLDADGYLYVTGRSDDMIISGGVNIYPRETEDVLIGHPAIDDVAVIGTPDPEFGESVLAVVTIQSGFTPSDALAQDIIAWTRDRIAHYKCPRAVRFVDELPRSVAGKMMKHRLTAAGAPRQSRQ
ncbi:AMP-binding protein [Cryptosporangium sp. NPDC048952]|uniref:AMP-binding protein n=1 Tax=Cryptosporangium sp. NPDC048952 TaxID=3363961 RepID=UPI00371470A4